MPNLAEQRSFPFVADEAMRQIRTMLDSSQPLTSSGALWSKLSPWPRIVWCRAAGISGNCHKCAFDQLSPEDRATLMLALENLVGFFQEIGRLRTATADERARHV